jgi:hypothetical protein
MNYQQTLELRGVPTDLAIQCTLILEKQNQDPYRDRTPEEQETIDLAYRILIRGIKHEQ